MKNYSIEIHFMDGNYKSQVWIYNNLSIDDVVAHYDMFPTSFLKDAVIYVNHEDRRLFLKDFFEFTNTRPKKAWYES